MREVWSEYKNYEGLGRDPSQVLVPRTRWLSLSLPWWYPYDSSSRWQEASIGPMCACGEIGIIEINRLQTNVFYIRLSLSLLHQHIA
jgi:hypothetical protein